MFLHELRQKINSSVDIESVLSEAIYLIEEASEAQDVTIEEIRGVYNRHCDEQVRLTPVEYQLALAIAAGEVAQQDGGNIQRNAAIQNIRCIIWNVQDTLGVGV